MFHKHSLPESFFSLSSACVFTTTAIKQRANSNYTWYRTKVNLKWWTQRLHLACLKHYQSMMLDNQGHLALMADLGMV